MSAYKSIIAVNIISSSCFRSHNINNPDYKHPDLGRAAFSARQIFNTQSDKPKSLSMALVSSTFSCDMLVFAFSSFTLLLKTPFLKSLNHLFIS